MADSNLLNKINGTGEVDTSMILDTLMYSDHFIDNENDYKFQTVDNIVNKMLSDPDLKGENRAAVQCVKNYLDSHPDSGVGDLVLSSSSDALGGTYDGAKAATFYSTDPNGNVKDVYVAFRGTGDGRWYDNGDAFSKEYSRYQQDAAEYFDYAMAELGVDESCNVITTGHSKGGNLSQFVALGSKNAYLIDNVYSFDGQGFSPEAIAYFKDLYGEDFYNAQRQKMYSISGDNDYVNVLGIKVIPEDHTVYIQTPCNVYDMKNSHGLYVIPDEDSDLENISGIGNLYDYERGGFLPTTEHQREMGEFAKSLSKRIMNLPPEEREDVCRSLMSTLEYVFTGGSGLHGEKATIEEYIGFASQANLIVEKLVFTPEGQLFIHQAIEDSGLYDMIRKALPFDESTTAGKIATLLTMIAVRGGVEALVIVTEVVVVILAEVISVVAKVVDVLRVAYEFFSGVLSDLKDLFKKLTSSSYRAAQKYLESATVIKLHTGDLRSLAERLWSVNSRLSALDDRLDSLYSRVKWTDLKTIITVLSADLRIGWSSKINNCANCLSDTAGRFESAEDQVLAMLG